MKLEELILLTKHFKENELTERSKEVLFLFFSNRARAPPPNSNLKFN